MEKAVEQRQASNVLFAEKGMQGGKQLITYKAAQTVLESTETGKGKLG